MWREEEAREEERQKKKKKKKKKNFPRKQKDGQPFLGYF